jgi:flavin-dependent dehydrogenase
MPNAEFDIIIVGGGPAGSSVALSLARLAPSLVDRTLIIDKATFPRGKLCGGGLTSRALRVLSELDIATDWLSKVRVNGIQIRLPQVSISKSVRRPFYVVRRDEFDSHLLDTARRRGATVHQGETLVRFHASNGWLMVQTTQAEYRARALVGADGANSRVRRLLSARAPFAPMMALEAMLPDSHESGHGLLLFDFRRITQGRPGYLWRFPTPLGTSLGVAHFGVYDRAGPDLATELLEFGGHLGMDFERADIRGWPAPRYAPELCYSRPHVLLVGDAAGTDSLWGEGITSALQFGAPAARSLYSAFSTSVFDFVEYEREIRRSRLGLQLAIRQRQGARFYDSGARWRALAADLWLQRATDHWPL